MGYRIYTFSVKNYEIKPDSFRVPVKNIYVSMRRYEGRMNTDKPSIIIICLF